MKSKGIESKSWELVRSYLETASPAQWHIFVARSNYDNNERALRWLIENPKTDCGTVLMIYWNLGAAWYVQFQSEEECEEYEKSTYRLLRLIERNYSSSYYMNHNIWFDPAHSEGGGPSDYPEIPVKSPILEIMLQSVNGSEYVEIESPAGYDDGLPIAVAEALYALHDED